MTTASVPDFEQLQSMANELLQSWQDFIGQPDLASQMRGRTLRQIAVTLGLACHTHAVAPAALTLLDADNALVAIPLIRTMYECAFTAQWVAQVDGAEEAFMGKQNKQRRNLLHAMRHVPLPDLSSDELDEAIVALDEQDDAKARLSASFESICNSLHPGGKEAYAHYRLMSQLSHPSDFLLDHYFAQSEGPLGIARRVTPDPESRLGWAAIAVASLIWAGQAVDYSTPGRSRRRIIRAAAKQLGVKPVLRPSF